MDELDPDEPVVLRESMPYEEAMVVKGLLDSAGIRCALVSPRGTDISSYTRSVPRWVRLLVRRADYDDAVAALEG